MRDRHAVARAGKLFHFLSISTLFLASMPSMAAVCTSHFYNDSSVAWTISGQDGGTTELAVAPNSTAEIQWSPIATHITISQMINGHLDQSQFQAHRMAGCYVIVSRGNTGPLRFNHPVMGDITIVQVGAKQPSH